MNRADRNVLVELVKAGDHSVTAYNLPNGHGHVTGAGVTPRTLSRLEGSGMIAFAADGGWRITDAGREALRQSGVKGGE